MAGGIRRLVEFGDRNQNGASTFITQDQKVAQAIRRHSMSRRGVIVETTANLEEEPVTEKPQVQPRTLSQVKGVTKPAQKPVKATATIKADKPKPRKAVGKAVPTDPNMDVRQYANFTVAKEAICKEFTIAKSIVRNPTALSKVAAEKGIIIQYTSDKQ